MDKGKHFAKEDGGSEEEPLRSFHATSMSEITPTDAAWLAPMRLMLDAPELRYRPFLDLLSVFGEGPLAYPKLTNKRHSLQTATRAMRAGESEPYVIMALLHDTFDYFCFGGLDHGEVAATMLGPFLDDQMVEVLALHVRFQDYYKCWESAESRNARERYRGHRDFEEIVRFCERYDQTSFDPNYPEIPLTAFEPIAQRVFAAEPKFRPSRIILPCSGHNL